MKPTLSATLRAISLCAILTSSATLAQTIMNHKDESISIWPGKAPDEIKEIGPERIIENKNPNDSTIRITDITDPKITIFPADPEKNTGAAVIICPGGGYSYLCYNREGIDVAKRFNSLGITGILLKYRTPTRAGSAQQGEPIKHALQDAQRAISIVRSRAAEWKIDPTRIGILGFSAGGNLTAFACTGFDNRQYAPVDKIDETSCRPDFGVMIYPAWLVDYKTLELRPQLDKVTEKTPPMIFFHAANDGHPAESSIQLYLATRKAGLKTSELHVYTTGGHGFGVSSNDEINDWPDKTYAWLKAIGIVPKSKK